jgi:uncharacterized membrane protein (UPF0127 family)
MRRFLAISSAIFCLAACDAEAATTGPQPMTFPTGTIRFDTPRGPWILKVEVASDDPTRQRGLMYRRELPRDRGMLFIFPSSEEHTFWMHNTLLSLDMVFMGEDRSVVGVLRDVPPLNEKARTVGKPSRYMLEIPAGEAAAHAVSPGTRVAFIDVAE